MEKYCYSRFNLVGSSSSGGGIGKRSEQNKDSNKYDVWLRIRSML